ncbi:MAG TPA: hypothetical protein VIK07_11350 [Bacteroidales bacterium]
MKRANLQLGLIQLLVVIGAIPAGYLFLSAPDGSKLGMTVEALAGSPFKDYFIPGLYLFIVNGLFNLVASILTLYKFKYSSFIGMALGLSLIVWVSVQVYSVGLTHFLQPTYFIIGIAEIVLSISIFRSEKLKNIINN